jgi:hypothetical protein
MHPTTISLKRIAPGYYETTDGRFEVVNTEAVPGYPRGAWYWRENKVGATADDWFRTKREAVEALNAWIQEQA